MTSNRAFRDRAFREAKDRIHARLDAAHGPEHIPSRAEFLAAARDEYAAFAQRRRELAARMRVN